MSIDGKVGTEGQGHSGCLATKSFHVSSLLGANPGDTSTWHALPQRPSCAKDIAELTLFFTVSSKGTRCFLEQGAQVFAKCHRSLN